MKIEEIYAIITDKNHQKHNEIYDFVYDNVNLEIIIKEQDLEIWFLRGHSNDTEKKAIIWEEYSNREDCVTEGAEGEYVLIEKNKLFEYADNRFAELKGSEYFE